MTTADPEMDLRAELRESQVEEVLDKLDAELIGLRAVKTRIRETAALLLVDRVRRRLELTSHTPTLHMSFTVTGWTGSSSPTPACARALPTISISRTTRRRNCSRSRKLMLTDLSYRFSAEAETTFADYIARRMGRPHFANARSIRNTLDRARLRQANRLFAAGTLTRRDLMTIESQDMLASRVFTESRADPGGAAESPEPSHASHS